MATPVLNFFFFFWCASGLGEEREEPQRQPTATAAVGVWAGLPRLGGTLVLNFCIFIFRIAHGTLVLNFCILCAAGLEAGAGGAR